ncbi:MAG: hypothetical protein JNM40_05590 [Myxococcales bacterium]|nr:hypothetical protein [Myxococcales bacterium]
MLSVLLPLATASTDGSAGATSRPTYVYVLAALFVLLIVAGAVLLFWWFKLRKRREEGTAYVTPAQSMTKTRLSDIWERFQSRLPSGVRATTPELPHFVVFGNTGAGKSALISRKVDWQGQTSQFIPSYTADPLLQLYLGSQVLVEEFSSAIQDGTAQSYNDALTKLWKSLEVEQIPTVIVVLSAPLLITQPPDQLRQQAQLLRGKINVLSETYGSTGRVRICLTHMDRLRGYSDLARFLAKEQAPLELSVGADPHSDLSESMTHYERYLPRALTTLPVSSFESIVEFLRGADQFLSPTASFVSALTDLAIGSLRPEVQGIYFASLAADEQISNPFTPPPQVRSTALGSRLARWLRPFGIRPVHAMLALLMLCLGLFGLTYVTRRHHVVVEAASEANLTFDQAVVRAQTAHNSGESDVVRRAERSASQSLLATSEAEQRFRPFHLIYRTDKKHSERLFIESIRKGYLLPSLERAIRQRARDKILGALVALYATKDNTLGSLIKASATDWSTDLNVPRDTLLDYIQYSTDPWTEVAIATLPPFPPESLRYSLSDLSPWKAFIYDVHNAIARPYITRAELSALQQRSAGLIEGMLALRRAAQLRQWYRNLAEESPLDMLKLFGQEVGILTPDPWLLDQKDPMERLLRMVSDSNITTEQAGTKSLYQLLRWLNETSESASAKKSSEHLLSDSYRFLFPAEGSAIDISRRDWEELLTRSRKRTFSMDESAPHPTEGPVRTKRCSKLGKKRGLLPPCKVTARSPASSGSAKKLIDRPTALPLWSQEEFTPKLAALLTGDELPAVGLSDVYNRVVYHREVLPLVTELKKALGGHRNLSAEERISLSRAVQKELARYSQGYCAALLEYHLGYRISAVSPSQLHSELVDIIKPGSRFVARLKTLVDNVTLQGLEEPYLRPLATCIADFRPIVELMTPKSQAPAAKSDPKAAGQPDAAQGTRPTSDTASSKVEGLATFHEAVAKLIADLDRAPTASTDKSSSGSDKGDRADKSAATQDKSAVLTSKLSALARSALAMHEGSEESSLAKAEQFLDRAGIAGPLRRPFLAPFLAVHQLGSTEIEQVFAQHWKEVMQPQITPLMSRFPFQRGAEREVAPSDLDVLSERRGPLFADLRSLYAVAVTERGESYVAKSGALGTLRLPKDMLPTMNKLAKLSRALFSADGNRQPLQLAIRGLPGPQSSSGSTAQSALAYLQIGKASAYGFNQQSSATTLQVEWWAQGAAVIGVERTVAKTGRKHTQTLEVTDSAWSLYRLLQRSTLDGTGVSTWRIIGDGPDETQIIRFAITPDPWELFGEHAQ